MQISYKYYIVHVPTQDNRPGNKPPQTYDKLIFMNTSIIEN